MVEDSIMQEFTAGKVSVVGVDVWNSSDTVIGGFITQTGITFPVTKNGAATATSYGVVANSMAVVDQNGIVRYVKQLGTASTDYATMSGMVSEAASTVRGLLANNVLHYPLMRRVSMEKQYGRNHDFTLAGRMVLRGAVSRNMLVSVKDGKPRLAVVTRLR